MRRLVLLSNSTNYGQPFLLYPEHAIKQFLGTIDKPLLFFPFAGVTISWDHYYQKVNDRFSAMGYDLQAIHLADDKESIIAQTGGIIIGGGNSFQLIAKLHEYGLIEPIQQAVENGTPYIGWSAGSNVACPTIMTTNDMPIVEPVSMQALDLFPHQINPHYTGDTIAGHGGESRDDRLKEYCLLNPHQTVIGLREGTMLQVSGKKIVLNGKNSARIFKHDYDPYELEPGVVSFEIPLNRE